ncbi:MAG TPA: TRAP transporter large permease [Kofleriaceae bacterium]|nr:TRAP transporter large permease [Kofleriaceae bacterium]
MAALLIVLLVAVFVSGAPLFTIMLGGTALGALSGGARGFESDFDGAVVKMFGVGTGEQVNVLSTIPLFIYAGYLLAEARTADRLVRFANALLGWLPGGLAIVTIGTCSLFTVFTGASGVTIIALGGVLMPALVRNGYPERFSMGLIAGTGSVGLLFPPALPLFIYGTVYGLTNLDPENWNTERFLFAGVVPGLVLVGMLSMVAITVAVIKKLPRQRFDLVELGRSFLVALPELFIPFGVILGLASGFGLPEIASITVLYVVILEVVVFRSVGARVLWAVSYEALAMIGAIFIIIFASTALTDFMVNAEVPRRLVEWTQDHVDSKIVFLLAINVILLIVGTVMDIFSAIVVVLPLIAPIAKAYGIDPYHLGVIFLLNLEVGYLHPPVGLNLFLTSVKFRRPITEVMWATIPFLLTMIAALLIITYVPALTVVPEAERRAPVGNLVQIVADGIEESRVPFRELALVDARGAPLLDAKGKQIVRQFKACALSPRCASDVPDDQRCPAGSTCESEVCVRPGVEVIRDESQRDVCQDLFFQVTKCRPDARANDPKQIECANREIASWVVKNLNGDALDQEKAVIVTREVALSNADGNPINGANGKQIVKRLEACDKLTGTQRETCRALFIEVSSCRIKPYEVAECTTDQATCAKAAIDGCVKDAIATWAEENRDDLQE